MNDFFDKLGAAVQRTADKVSTEVNVAAQEQKVRELYQALGKLYYQRCQSGGNFEGPEFDELVHKVREGLVRINHLRNSQTVDPANDTDFTEV